MTYKIGRNDPCPCGSGKKYKQCCANSPADFVEPERKGHAGAAERAIDWLMNKHRKAVSVAITERLFDELSPEEEEALGANDPETWNSIQHNATEWLLAEGEILVHGEPRPVSDGPSRSPQGKSLINCKKSESRQICRHVHGILVVYRQCDICVYCRHVHRPRPQPKIQARHPAPRVLS